MNAITETLLQTYMPRLAVVVYTPAADSWVNSYLESHPIDGDGKLLEGRPLKQETLQGLVDIFFDDRQTESQFTGMIPSNLLKFEILPGGQYEMVWYRPEEQRNIFFADSLHIPSGKVWVPAVIYRVEKKSMKVFAIKTSTRPDEKTPLFRAPFHNVSNDGDVCLGSATVKKPIERSYASAIQYWEDMFWLSEFSHLHGSSNPTKSNVNLLWKRLLKEPKMKWSQLDELKPIKNGRKTITLESIL